MARQRILAELEEETEIDLSSMIDCIFILLIFFIVTTVFVEEQGVQVSKPDAAAAAAVEETENVVLEITSDNRVLIDEIELNVSEVPARVKSGLSGEDTPVIIRAHEKAAHGTFVAVWDAARRGGATTLSFNTVN